MLFRLVPVLQIPLDPSVCVCYQCAHQITVIGHTVIQALTLFNTQTPG